MVAERMVAWSLVAFVGACGDWLRPGSAELSLLDSLFVWWTAGP